MLIKILYSLLILLFLLIIGWRIFNYFIYPVLQFFKRKNEHGYILLSVVNGEHYEHRAMVEKLVGRKLSFDEEVHHINGKKWDNRRTNLALLSRDDHLEWHRQLSTLYKAKKYPTIRQQKEILATDFQATLF